MRSKYSRSRPMGIDAAWFRCRETGMSERAICELFGMSRKTYSKWYNRYSHEGMGGLEVRSTPRRIFDHTLRQLRSYSLAVTQTPVSSIRLALHGAQGIYLVSRVTQRGSTLNDSKHRPTWGGLTN